MLRLTVPLVLCCAMAQAQNLGCTFDPNVDGYIEVPHGAQLVPRSGITVEAWFTYDDAALPSGWRYPTIMRQGIGPQGENIMLRVDADNSAQRELRWRIKTTSGATFDCNYLFAPGEFLVWTHVAGTYDGNTLALYVNGQQVVSTATNGEAIRDVVDVLRIGKGSDVATPIEVWNGELDEVRLWPFARTAEDIQQTMNLELQSVPGYVSTWNLNGDALDSSSDQHGVIGGTVAFTVNPLPLTGAPTAFGIAAGAGTPGCTGELRLCPSGPSVTNYADYRLVCTRTAPSSFVFWGASLQAAPAPLSFLGVDVWLDPSSLVAVGLTANGLGSAGLNLPIPPTASGFSFVAQCLVPDACAAQGWAASDALVLVVQ